ncbi:hypothetical protein [Oricola thermophila]|uniref:Lipoprotein n=1 Tax=Oricola thermophila TaxID=2742145 RepID=A0A6N1VE25_9HYPH|nr:hypothetical protein [Oricola thermophila]QKV17855.1 hypothetical protein HTY61_04965 [Oricola thermophila]
MIRKSIPAVLSALALAGCVSTEPQTPPTYTFNAPADATKATIVSVYSADGFIVQRESDHQVVMQRFRGGSDLKHSFSIVGSSPTTVTGNIMVGLNDFTWNAGARSFMDGYMSRVRAMTGQ